MIDTSPVRVLVVDDDPDVYELMSAVAGSHPLVDVVAGARSPEEALTLTRRLPPDAILLDHHFRTAEPPDADLPEGNPIRGMTGLEAVEFLRSAAPEAVIAIYSCNTGLAGSAENSGADMYIVKGPSPRAVLDEVAGEAIRRRG